MDKMTNNQYEYYKMVIRNWRDNGRDKEQLGKLYRSIIYDFQDGLECVRDLDGYQNDWNMEEYMRY